MKTSRRLFCLPRSMGAIGHTSVTAQPTASLFANIREEELIDRTGDLRRRDKKKELKIDIDWIIDGGKECCLADGTITSFQRISLLLVSGSQQPLSRQDVTRNTVKGKGDGRRAGHFPVTTG